MLRVVYRVGLMMMVVATLGLYGCGSSDGPLNEIGQRYIATLTVLDLDEDTIQVDAFQDICDVDDNGTITWEDFSDALGEIEVAAGENSAGLTLRSYSIAYIPLLSSDQMGTTVTPPDLTDILQNGAVTIDVPQNGSTTFTITLISMDTKSEYGTKLFADSSLQYLISARYLIRVTLHFEDVTGNDVDIAVERTVYFSDYDHC